MTLKQFVISNVNPDEYYTKRFAGWNPHTRELVKCPFHDDGSRPNLSISLKNGGARCHSSRCRNNRFGNIVHFEAELTRQRESITARNIFREFVRPLVASKLLLSYRNNLATNTQYILKIKREMGLSLGTIRRFHLGLDTESNRITIPIYDQFNQCVNVRYYRLPSERTKSDDAKLHNLKGYGRLDLFPLNEMANFKEGNPIFIMASEKEAMLALQDGLCAVSSTNGEGSWDASWDNYLQNHSSFSVFDNDKGGKEATKAFLGRSLLGTTAITLPFKQKRKDYKDYADWRLKEKHSPKELERLARSYSASHNSNGASHRNSPRTEGERTPANAAGDSEYPELPPFYSEELLDIVAISSRDDVLNKRIRTQGIVAAKSPNTFSIPWKFLIKSKKATRPDFIYQLPMSRELLRFIKSGDGVILQRLQELVGSGSVEIEPIGFLTATEVEIIPTAVIDQDVPYVVQRCYYFGKRIESNVPYYLEVIPTSEIRSQETIGIITAISPLSKSIDKFELTPELNADFLQAFSPDEHETVYEKLLAIGEELTTRHTRVYNRMDWVLSALLTWTSPIGWRFPKEPELQRGWLNTLALGDTETGKSKVSKALKSLFNCGVFVSGENCTFVGLVGGAIKASGGQLMLRWGRIPLSDKQLVVLEELSGLSVEDIANMSDVRSSGVAHLDKGGINSETNSRTRLLCLSNTRSARKSLSQYLFGVHAVSELIGHGEDIARFDIITTLTDKEVSIDIINSADFATDANTIGIEKRVWQSLIHFIWSLTPEQIYFDDKAYEECLSETKRLSGLYHPSIPIFKGGSGRYKLGRVAASIACLQFSYDAKSRRIRVKKTHVQAAAQLLESIYNKRSFGYAEYSQQMFARETVGDTALLRRTLKEKISKSVLPKVIETMIHLTQFSRDEICAIAGTTIMHADQILGTMMRERAIRKGVANLWEITPAGKTFLETLLQRMQN